MGLRVQTMPKYHTFLCLSKQLGLSSPNIPSGVHLDCPRNSEDYLDSTGTGSGQLAGVGWGTSPSGVQVESNRKGGGV